MEQREIIHRYYVLGTSTLDKVLKVLLNLSSDGVSALKDKFLPLKGENNLYKLMNHEDLLTSAQPHEKVNLDRLKEQLEAQGLPFASRETKGGANFHFRIRGTELAKKTLERVPTNIKENSQVILRRPDTMTFDERLAYAAANKKYVGRADQAETVIKGRKL